MIDLSAEQTLSLVQAAALLPPARQGRPVSPSCVFRWIKDGVRTPDGRTVRLEAVRLSGRWLTSREALQRFAEAQTPEFADSTPTNARPTVKAQKRAADRAGAELEGLGI